MVESGEKFGGFYVSVTDKIIKGRICVYMKK